MGQMRRTLRHANCFYIKGAYRVHVCRRGVWAQEMWLVSAVAGLGAARELAMDARNARLRLDPTAAVAHPLQLRQGAGSAA